MINARKYRNTKAVKENFDDLLAMGAVVHGSASPITVVPKKDNSLRICIDYTVLNAHTRPGMAQERPKKGLDSTRL